MIARLAILALAGTIVCGSSALSAEPLQAELTLRLRPLHTDRDAPVVTAIAVDPRGKLIAAAGDDHVIRVLSCEDWSLVAELDLHEDWVRDLQFSPDGKLLASVANDGKLLLWERDANWRTVEAMGDAPALRSVRFSPDGTMMATVGFAPEVYLVGVRDERRPRLNCGCRDLRTVAYRGDGLLLGVAGRSGDVHFYDAVTGSTVEGIQLHARRINALLFIGNTARTLTVAEDGHAVIYDSNDHRVIHDVAIPNTILMTACMIDDQYGAVAGSDNTIHIIDVNSGKIVRQLVGHSGSVASLAYQDGLLYSGGFDTTLRIWSTAAIEGASRVAGTEAAVAPDARTSRKP